MPHQTNVFLFEQGLLEKPGLKLWQQAHGQINLSVRHVLFKRRLRNADHLQGYARGRMGKRIHQDGQKIHFSNVGQGDGEVSSAGLGVESASHIQRLLYAVHGHGHRCCQLKRVGRWRHAGLRANKQLVIQT